MLIACWSAKGGSGTTVVAAALALSFARASSGALLADFAGDAPCVLGLPEPDGPGLSDWLDAGATVPVDSLRRIEVEAAPGLALLTRGAAPAEATRVTGVEFRPRRSSQWTAAATGRRDEGRRR